MALLVQKQSYNHNYMIMIETLQNCQVPKNCRPYTTLHVHSSQRIMDGAVTLQWLRTYNNLVPAANGNWHMLLSFFIFMFVQWSNLLFFLSFLLSIEYGGKKSGGGCWRGGDRGGGGGSTVKVKGGARRLCSKGGGGNEECKGIV